MLTQSPVEATRGSEKRVVFPICQPPNEQRELHGMIVAPHRRFAARNLPARRNVIPAVGPVIHAMQQQSLVLPIGGEIRFVEERAGNRESGLKIFYARDR